MATEALTAAEARQAQARKAIEGFGEAYHPWDPTTGAERSAPDVSRTLEAHVDEIARLVTQAGLSQRASAHVEKARRMLAAMRATIAFVHLTVLSCIRALAREVEVERAVLTLLIPGLYLRRVAAKAPTPERRAATRALSDQLLARARAPDSPLAALEPTRRDQVEHVALACADLFQRSSACVEGRNGQLALRDHSLHRLGARTLAALTLVHNFFIRRSDATTAAERFFGAQPADMFAWVLDHLDVPARPARARSKARLVAA